MSQSLLIEKNGSVKTQYFAFEPPPLPPPPPDAEGGDGEEEVPPYLENVLAAFPDAEWKGTHWQASCPSTDHGADGQDEHPSLSISVGKDGLILLHCWANCEFKDILEGAELRAKDLRCPKGQKSAKQLSYGRTSKATETLSEGDANLRDLVYRKMLEPMGLAGAHREALLKRGLGAKEIEEGGYRSFHSYDQDSVLEKLYPKYKDGLFKVPGFYPAKRLHEFGKGYAIVEEDALEFGTDWAAITGGLDGLVIPVRDWKRRIVALKTRRDDKSPKYIYWSSAKRNGPSSGSPVHVPVWITPFSPTIRVTEGELKADVASHLSKEMATIGVPGVSSWRKALPVLVERAAKKVLIAWDWPDVESKPNVCRSLRDFFEALVATKRYAAVGLERWDPQYKGIDDALAAGDPTITQVWGDAAWEMINVLCAKLGVKDEEPEEETAPEAYNDPHRLARSFLASQGNLYRYYRQAWHRYTGTHYVVEEEADVKAKLNRHMKAEFEKVYPMQLAAAKAKHEKDVAEAKRKRQDEPEFRTPVCAPVTQKLLGDVLQALKGVALVDGGVERERGVMLPQGEKRPLIAFKNGLFDPEKRKLYKHTPAWFSTVCMPYDYDPKAPCPTWVRALAYWMEEDRERIYFLQEYAGYLLFGGTCAHKMVFLLGEGGNGKSAFLAGLEAMLGGLQNVSHVPLEAFGERFALYPTVGKLANVCADTGDDALRVNEAVLKQYVSGDPMMMDRKNKDQVEALPTARLIFSSNKLPRFRDPTNGLWRRPDIVPFSVTVPQEMRVEGMDKAAWWLENGEAPGIFNWALAGWVRYVRQGRRFTRSKVCEEAKEGHRTFCNPAKAFLEEHVEVVTGREDVFLNCQDLYRRYVGWCTENGHKPLASGRLGEEVGRTFPAWAEETRRRKKGMGEDEQGRLADRRRFPVAGSTKTTQVRVYLGLRLRYVE
jgi:P4 family phage/plasmid primase-like protien